MLIRNRNWFSCSNISFFFFYVKKNSKSLSIGLFGRKNYKMSLVKEYFYVTLEITKCNYLDQSQSTPKNRPNPCVI